MREAQQQQQQQNPNYSPAAYGMNRAEEQIYPERYPGSPMMRHTRDIEAIDRRRAPLSPARYSRVDI